MGHAGGQLADRLHLLDLSELLLEGTPGGHIDLDPDEVRQAALRVPHRGDRQLVPEGGSVLAVVQQLDGTRLAGPDRLAEAGDGRGVGVLALQKSAVAAEELLGHIPRHPLEPGADVHDGVVRLAGVGDRQPLGRRPHCPVPHPEGVLGPPPGGDVPGHPADPAALGPQGELHHQPGRFLAGGRPPGFLPLNRHAPGQALPVARPEQVGHVPRPEVVVGLPLPVGRLRVELPPPGRVDVQEAAALVLDEGGRGGVVHERAEPPLARPHGLLRLLRLGDVAGGAEDPRYDPAPVPVRGLSRQVGPGHPGRGQHFLLRF